MNSFKIVYNELKWTINQNPLDKPHKEKYNFPYITEGDVDDKFMNSTTTYIKNIRNPIHTREKDNTFFFHWRRKHTH